MAYVGLLCLRINFIDNINISWNCKGYFKSDGIHPNKTGSQLFGAKIRYSKFFKTTPSELNTPTAPSLPHNPQSKWLLITESQSWGIWRNCRNFQCRKYRGSPIGHARIYKASQIIPVIWSSFPSHLPISPSSVSEPNEILVVWVGALILRVWAS